MVIDGNNQEERKMQNPIFTANADVIEFECDTLILKYAQSLHGADRAVARALGVAETELNIPAGDHRLVPTKGSMPFSHVLFIGAPHLSSFGYREIRNFANAAMNVISHSDVAHARVAMTMHGVGYGLDEREAFTAQVAGIIEYFSSNLTGVLPQRVTIVERETNRYHRISAILNQIPGVASHESNASSQKPVVQEIPDAGVASDTKRLVFVAMPYNDQMVDVFEFGIKEPVNNAGCLCERCDREAFTGDVLDRIRTRIADADVVIADVTGANPNVYLEVGYAWGREVQTLLIAREGENLEFDLRTHRCLFYKNINHLRKQLNDFLERLMSTGQQRIPHVRPPATGGQR